MAGGTVKNQYLYGALNRMEQAVNQAGTIARYTYNGLGHRGGDQVGTNQTLPQHFSQKTLEAGLNPMVQLRSSSLTPTKQIDYTLDLTRQYHNLLQKTEENDHTQTYLWDGNVVGMLEHGSEGAESYYLQDDLGSPIRLLYENGEVQETYGYGEFGEDLYQNQNLSQPFGFTGYQKDEVAGTYFAQAREYRAEAGGFVGQDIIKGVIRQPITLNQYLYCWSNPVAFMDLDGMQPQKSADFYDNTTIEPLDPNKKYYTFEENPNTEKGTFSIGGTIDATIFIGISLDMFVSVDRYGNIALQTSIAEPFNDRYDTKYIGGFDFGLGIKVQITKAKTVFDLEKKENQQADQLHLVDISVWMALI